MQRSASYQTFAYPNVVNFEVIGDMTRRIAALTAPGGRELAEVR